MTRFDPILLAPLLVLAGTALVVLIAISIKRSHGLAAAIAIGGLALATLALYPASSAAPASVPLLAIDPLGLSVVALLLIAALAIALLAYDYLEHRDFRAEEFYLLLLLATLGASILVLADHFVSLFLGLELLSVSLYALIGYDRCEPASSEAAIEYLILAGATSSMLLFGLALAYASTASLELAALEAARPSPALSVGLVLLLAGLGFKLALVPFHLWAPDVYAGAPPPVAAFVATVSKGAAFALLLRIAPATPSSVVALTAGASMIAGNVLALEERELRRMLAYSSIAQIGYLLLATTGGRAGASAGLFYLAVYFASTIAAFGVVTVLDRETHLGLFWRRPWLASTLALALLSLAGLPITAGFVGKIYLLEAGLAAGDWALAFCFLLGSAIGLYYYLRVIGGLISAAPQAAEVASTPTGARITLALASLLLLLLGLCPTLLLGVLAT